MRPDLPPEGLFIGLENTPVESAGVVSESNLKHVLNQVNVATSESETLPASSDVETSTVDVIDESNWEEKRFLNLIEHYAQVALEQRQRRYLLLSLSLLETLREVIWILG